MNDPNIIRKLGRGTRALGQLATVALLGLMLWLGGVASASAQSIPSTSPCIPLGINKVPPGWTITRLSPDCSTTTNYAGSGDPWLLGNVPPTPSGDTSFPLMGATSAGFTEAMSTTITGLQVGRVYNLSVFLNGNPTSFPGFARACPGIVTINGVPTTYPAPSDNTWAERLFPFVATGSTATLTIETTYPQANCTTNFFVGANAVALAPADVQVTKAVSPVGAVASGSVLTYTLIARNNGPATAANVQLRDTPSAGLNCLIPSATATCSASGGASCPGATVPVSSLIGAGITLPNLPVGGQATVTMRCTVTATGR